MKLRFCKIARANKMLVFNENHISIAEKFCKEPYSPDNAKFFFAYEDIYRMCLTSDPKMSLDSINLLDTHAPSEAIAPFEYKLCLTFIKNCMVTAFPDHRQKYMKSIKQFFIRCRTVHTRDMKANSKKKMIQ